jgi:hypothetical protein
MGNNAVVKSKIEGRPFEVRMRKTVNSKNANRWTITSFRDEQLANDIAATIGQEILAIATSGGEAAAERLGIGNISEIIKQAEKLLR